MAIKKQKKPTYKNLSMFFNNEVNCETISRWQLKKPKIFEALRAWFIENSSFEELKEGNPND